MTRVYKSFFLALAAAGVILAILAACSTPLPSPMPNAGGKPMSPMSPFNGVKVALGIDVLTAQGFGPLQGKRVGLITNQTSVNGNGVPTRQVLHADRRVNLTALFTPEHGLDGKEKAAAYISTRMDPLTGLVAHSLYGPTRKPTADMMSNVDVLLFDLQDIGSRSYTYISTMLLAMEACGEMGKTFMVLDRPNPLGGQRICGPPMEKSWISFVGQFPAPYVHGLTAGEIAQMANAKGWTKRRCKLEVIRMADWQRNMIWSNTGLKWVPTSPNIPDEDSPFYYAATGIFGSLTGGDIGIGTTGPFELIGSKGIDPDEYAGYLNGYKMPGVKFSPYRSITRPGYAGAKMKLDPHAPIDLAGLNLIFIDTISRRIQGDLFQRTSRSGMNIFHKVYGSDNMHRDLASGKTPAQIIVSWTNFHNKFRQDRQPYLLY